MGWKAELALDYHRREAVSYIGKIRHKGPLLIQKSFYPENSKAVHNYLIHPPGGLVGGDSLDLQVRLEPGSSVLLTTPAAGKIYKTITAPSLSSYSFKLEAQAELAWLPLETIVFDGARHRMSVSVDVATDAKLTAWDILSFGRPGAAETFTQGMIDTRLALHQEGLPELFEQMRWEGGSEAFTAPWGLHGRSVLGCLYLHWPEHTPDPRWLGDLSTAEVELGGTLRGRWYLLRGRAHCALHLREQFLRILSAMHLEHWHQPFIRPRIWAY